MMAGLGIELSDWLSVSERVALAQWAEAKGFDSAYAAEVADPDPFVVSALALAATSRIRLATGIAQIGPRSVPAIASSAASVASVAPGRFALGVGISSKTIVSQWHGLRYERPLLRARESVELLRTLLAGGPSDGRGTEVRSKGYRLTLVPQVPPPILLAGLNPGMMRLAGSLADGVWLNFLPIGHAEEVVRVIRQAATDAGRAAPEILLSVACDVTDDPAASRANLRGLLRFYVASPSYRMALSWHGFEQEMKEVEAGLADRDRAAVSRALTDELVDSVSLIGSAEHCRARLARYLDAGITSPSLAPIEPSRATDSLEALSRLTGT